MAWTFGSLTNPHSRTGVIESWTVPITGPYMIEATGARGGIHGGGAPGRGTKMSGVFLLNVGDVLSILAGRQGSDSASNGAPGGGGTFVALGATPLIVAGGGGGNNSAGSSSAMDATITNRGAAYNSEGRSGAGGGGGSFAAQNTSLRFGRSFTGGGFGGTGSTSVADGGFGGGGGADSGNSYSGGGGGYSGGDETANSGQYQGTAGGGGSYNSGTNQLNQLYLGTGSGLVVITSVAPLAPKNVTATPSLVQVGDEVIIGWQHDDSGDPNPDAQQKYQLRWRKVN